MQTRSQSSGVVRGTAASAASSAALRAREQDPARARNQHRKSRGGRRRPRPACIGFGVDQTGYPSLPAAVLEVDVGAQHERGELRDQRLRQLVVNHEQHVVAVRGEAHRRQHASLPVAGGGQHPWMALEAQDVIRKLTLQEGLSIAARDRDDGIGGQLRAARGRHRAIVSQHISPNARQLAVGSHDPFWQNGLAMLRTAERPLSPHLQVYRPMYTMVLSILHRASGLYLAACGFLFVGWMVSAALGPTVYACAVRIFSSLGMRIVLALALAAFWYHLFTGLRHLAWDAGVGFEKRAARRSGRLVVVLAAAAFAATLLLTPAGRFLAGWP